MDRNQVVRATASLRPKGGRSGLLETRAIQSLQSCVRADQCQGELLPRDRWYGGVVAPPQLEHIAGLFDWNGLPPRPARPVIFGQHKLVDVDLLPICRQRPFVAGGGVLMFFRRCWLRWFSRVGRRLRSRVKEPDPETVAHDSSFSQVIAPTQREHVAVDFNHNRLIPAVFEAFLGNDQIAQCNLVPASRQVGVTAWWICRSSAANVRSRQPNWRRAIAVTGGSEQLVVQIATDEWHECLAGRMNSPDSAAISAIFGSSPVMVRNCNWLAALRARVAAFLSNLAAFGLPRLSMPNKTSGEGQRVADVE